MACVVSVIQRVDVRKSIIKLYISIIEKVYTMEMGKGENQHRYVCSNTLDKRNDKVLYANQINFFTTVVLFMRHIA